MSLMFKSVKLEKYGEVFNIGTGTNYSVNELAKMISDKTELIEPRLGEARFTKANNSKAKRFLGWQPKVHLCDWIAKEVNK